MSLTSKEKLMKATIDAISENGLHSVTTSKIAKKAKLSEAMIYKNFGNKDEMIVSSCLQIKKDLCLFVLPKVDNSKDFGEQLYVLWISQVEYFIDNKQALSSLIQFEHSKYMDEVTRKNCFELIHPIFSYFERGVELGFFKSVGFEIVNILLFSPILLLAESIVSGRLDNDKNIIDFIFNSSIKSISN